jgi:hypothetical protein
VALQHCDCKIKDSEDGAWQEHGKCFINNFYVDFTWYGNVLDMWDKY